MNRLDACVARCSLYDHISTAIRGIQSRFPFSIPILDRVFPQWRATSTEAGLWTRFVQPGSPLGDAYSLWHLQGLGWLLFAELQLVAVSRTVVQLSLGPIPGPLPFTRS